MENNVMAVKELERGRDFAEKLRGLIFQHDDKKANKVVDSNYDKAKVVDSDDDKANNKVVDSAEDLAAKVLHSFTTTLSLLTHYNNNNISAYSSISPSAFSRHFPSNSNNNESLSHDDEIPASKNRRSTSSSSIKDPSSSSPKKRKSSVQTWVQHTEMSPKDDGYAWRKYGQKIILNAEHPRNYFRCSNKYDQGCEATKQVQKIQEHPPLYRTTYFGHHTCTDLLNPLMFTDDDPQEHLNPSSSNILSFNNNHNNNYNHITTFDPKVNNNNNSFSIQQNQSSNNHFLSSGSLFPSSGSVGDEEQFHDIMEDRNINNNDRIINADVPSCSFNDWLVSLHDDQQAVPSTFGSGDADQAAVLNSPIFDDYPLVFEDLLLDDDII